MSTQEGITQVTAEPAVLPADVRVKDSKALRETAGRENILYSLRDVANHVKSLKAEGFPFASAAVRGVCLWVAVPTDVTLTRAQQKLIASVRADGRRLHENKGRAGEKGSRWYLWDPYKMPVSGKIVEGKLVSVDSLETVFNRYADESDRIF